MPRKNTLFIHFILLHSLGLISNDVSRSVNPLKKEDSSACRDHILLQNPLVVREPPPTTLLRGRTEPEDEGRTDDEALLLLAEDEDEVLPEGLAVVVGLLPEDGLAAVDGLPFEAGLAPDVGFAAVDGELDDGAEGLDAGGGVACAIGVPPLDRL